MLKPCFSLDPRTHAKYNIHYNKFEGSDEFRTAIANHWQKIIFGEDRNVVLGKEQVATCAGCTVALETLARTRWR